MHRRPPYCVIAALLAGACLPISSTAAATPATRANPRATTQPASAPASRPAVRVVPYFGRKLEPNRPVVLHGAGQSRRDFPAYQRAMGTSLRPVIYMTYITARHASARHAEELAKRLARTGYAPCPQIGMSFDSHQEETAAGTYDDRLLEYFRALAKWNRPVFVRIGYECNGRWNGYKPKLYIQAFRRISGLIRKAKGDNIAAVWCYAADARNLHNMMDWYPGDTWVDWWAIDLFSPEHLSQADTLKFLALARKRSFPVMIGESTPRYVGASDGAADWAKWYKPYFELIRRHGHIKAFCYIRCDWSRTRKEWADWGDSRLDLYPEVLRRWKAELADPMYYHFRSAAELRRLLAPR